MNATELNAPELLEAYTEAAIKVEGKTIGQINKSPRLQLSYDNYLRTRAEILERLEKGKRV